MFVSVGSHEVVMAMQPWITPFFILQMGFSFHNIC